MQKLESFKEWDMVLTVKIDGILKGNKDGVLINVSPQEVASQVTNYENNNATDFGFINKVKGVVVVIRAGTDVVDKYGSIAFIQTELMSTLDTYPKRLKSSRDSSLQPSTLLIRSMQGTLTWTVILWRSAFTSGMNKTR